MGKLFSGVYYKKIIKYLCVYLVLLLLTIPILLQAYSIAKRLAIDSKRTKMLEGLNQLEREMNNAVQISEFMVKDDDFRKLLLLSGQPEAKDYRSFKKLQTQFSHLSLISDMVGDAFILFKNNSLFITNNLFTTDCSNAYPQFFAFHGKDEMALRLELFHNLYDTKLLPECHIVSQYNTPSEYSGIPFLMNSSTATTSSPNAIMVFIFQKDRIVSSICGNTGQTGLKLFLYDGFGNTITSFSSLEKESDEECVTIQSHSTNNIVHATLLIPKSFFRKNIYSTLYILLIYLIAGILFFFVITVLLIRFEGKKAYVLINSAAKLSGIDYNNTNEYTFSTKAMDKIYKKEQEHLSQLQQLNTDIRTACLETLLKYSIMPQIIAVFDNTFERLFRDYIIP